MMHSPRKLYILVIALIAMAAPSFAQGESGYAGGSERVQVHLARDVHFSGDILHLKAYLGRDAHAANLLSPSANGVSRVIYLTLSDAQGRPVTRLELDAANGTASRGIWLHDTLQTGFYGLAAWTNVMSLEGSPPFFRQLLIINRFDTAIGDFVRQNRLLPFAQASSITEDADAEVDVAVNALQDDLMAFDPVDNAVVRLSRDGGIPGTEISLQPGRQEYAAGDDVRISLGPAVASSPLSSASIAVSRREALFLHPGRPITPAIERENYGIHDLPASLVIPEYSGPVLSGMVVKQTTHEAVPGAMVLLSAADTLANLKYFETLDDGSFYFLIDKYHKDKTLYLSLLNQENLAQDNRIMVRNKFAVMRFTPEKPLIGGTFMEYVDDALMIRRIQRVYGGEANPRQALDRQHDAGIMVHGQRGQYPPRLYYRPAHIVFTNNYLPFDNLMSLVNEIVPGVRIRERDGKLTAAIIHPESRSVLPGEPAFFFDGVYVPDINLLADLTSRDISRVEVINTPWSFGALEFQGLVALFGSREGHEMPSHPQYTVVPGTQGSGSSDVGAWGDRTWDDTEGVTGLHETMLWLPEVCDEEGLPEAIVFTAGRLPGTYEVVFTGLTKAGEFVQGRTTILIKSEP